MYKFKFIEISKRLRSFERKIEYLKINVFSENYIFIFAEKNASSYLYFKTNKGAVDLSYALDILYDLF